jgi:hypothetical protein
MAVTSDGSPKPVRGRIKYGSSTRKRRSSIDRSSISGASWERTPLPLSLRQPAYPKSTKPNLSATVRSVRKARLQRTPIQPGASRVIVAPNQGVEQVRAFDAFVDAPSPFAKHKSVAKDHDYHPDLHSDLHAESVHPGATFTNSSIPIPSQPYHTIPPPPFHSHHLNNFQPLTPSSAMPFNMTAHSSPGYLDARTRAINVALTRPEWTTWDFVDLFITNLPPGVRTVDLWNTFRVEGEVNFIDIFVTRGGEKDTKARLRFRQVQSHVFAQCA